MPSQHIKADLAQIRLVIDNRAVQRTNTGREEHKAMEDDAPIIVSACLAGLATRYDGKASPHPAVMELLRRGKALPVCPEQIGGLPTPRTCHEIVGARVEDRSGNDHTEAFESGARQALELAEQAGCRRAILKSRSPSCGSGTIYDGSFSGKLIAGDGVFAALLKAHGVEVVSEEDLSD
jgi:uncharacterized protein YbbK (DUF523 family)